MAVYNLWLLVFLSIDIYIGLTVATFPLNMDVNLICNDKLGFNETKNYLDFILSSVLSGSQHHKHKNGVYTKTLCSNYNNSACVYIFVDTDIIWKQCKSRSKNDDIIFDKIQKTNMHNHISRSLLSTSEPNTEPTLEPTIEPTVEPTTEPTQEPIGLPPTTEPTTSTQTPPDLWHKIKQFCQKYPFWSLLGALCFSFIILILIYFICATYRCCCCHDNDKKDNSQKLKESRNKQNTKKSYDSVKSDDEDVDKNKDKNIELINMVKSNCDENFKYQAMDVAEEQQLDSDEKMFILDDNHNIHTNIDENDLSTSTSTSEMFPSNRVEPKTTQKPNDSNSKREQQIVINIHNHLVDASPALPVDGSPGGFPVDLPNLPNETYDTDTEIGEGFDLNAWIMQSLKECAPEKDEWKQYWNNFRKHKITEDVLILLSANKQNTNEEWKELLPEIGPRLRFQELWEKELLRQQQKELLRQQQ